jgi:hypothetical protein
VRELRLETFNTFNHAQFFGPTSVNANISSTSFGPGGQRDAEPCHSSASQIQLLIEVGGKNSRPYCKADWFSFTAQ